MYNKVLGLRKEAVENVLDVVEDSHDGHDHRRKRRATETAMQAELSAVSNIQV